MGEYADDYFRAEFKRMHGVDPGSMYPDDDRPERVKLMCPKCQRRVRTPCALSDHMRDKHGITTQAAP